MKMKTARARRTRARGYQATICSAALVALMTGCGNAAPAADDVQEEAVEPVTMAPMPTPRILEPADGAELTGDVRVLLGAENITILPAGDTTANSGHHHLFLNTAPTALGMGIPVGEANIVHLGKAQTEYTFAGLEPGEYTLIAVIGDLVHRVLPQAMDTVHFTVLGTE